MIVARLCPWILVLLLATSAAGQSRESISKPSREQLRAFAGLVGTWRAKQDKDVLYLRITSSDTSDEVRYTLYRGTEYNSVPTEQYHGVYRWDSTAGQFRAVRWNADSTTASGDLIIRSPHLAEESLTMHGGKSVSEIRMRFEIGDQIVRYRGEYRAPGVSEWKPAVDVKFQRISGFGWIE